MDLVLSLKSTDISCSLYNSLMLLDMHAKVTLDSFVTYNVLTLNLTVS